MPYTVAQRHGASTGFTLVELMVSISIIAVLLGVLAPALGAARRRAVEIELLSSERESMRLISLYSADNGGAFPLFGTPLTNDAHIQWNGKRIALTYWQQSEYWGLYLASKGYAGAWITKGPRANPSAFDDEYVDPECPGCSVDQRSWFTLSFTVFASPAYFKQGAQQQNKSLHKPQRQDAVVFPSKKGILRWHVRQLHRGQPVSRAWQTVQFADEHGAIVQYSHLRPGAWDDPATGASWWTVNATIDGVKGRDI